MTVSCCWASAELRSNRTSIVAAIVRITCSPKTRYGAGQTRPRARESALMAEVSSSACWRCWLPSACADSPKSAKLAQISRSGWRNFGITVSIKDILSSGRSYYKYATPKVHGSRWKGRRGDGNRDTTMAATLVRGSFFALKMIKKPSKKTAKPVPPNVSTFVTCDAIARDPNSGKATLYGVFNQVFAEKFPSGTVPFSLYASIAGGQGKHALAFEVLDPKGNRVLLEGEQDTTFSVDCDPSSGGELLARGAISFKTVGDYDFVIRSGRKRLAIRTIKVVRRAQKSKPKKTAKKRKK